LLFCYIKNLRTYVNQEAVAVALERSAELNYFTELKQMYQNKRDKLRSILDKHGLSPIVPQGISLFLFLFLF
jgi:aspartate/methionine/tyrosine aminotransferase